MRLQLTIFQLWMLRLRLVDMSRKGYPSHVNPLDVDASMGP